MLLFSAIGTLISGCTVGPNYRPPTAPVAPAFKETSSPNVKAATPSAISYRDWWKVFHDPALDDLEEQANSANRDIKVAVARVDEAAAQTRSARSGLFPMISAAPNASRNREAQDRPNNLTTGEAASTYNDIRREDPDMRPPRLHLRVTSYAREDPGCES